MASTYTDIGTELMTTGENAGTWGSTTNTNIKILEEAIRGYVAQSIAGSAATTALTYSDGSTGDAARNMVIALTGSITGNQVVTVTAKEKLWIVDNQTSGAYTVQFMVSGQTGVTWAATDKGTKILYCNGTDVIDSDIGGVGSYDLNGEELTLDADSDTSITASTDDQIDFEIAGADDFTMTANAFNVLTGSHVTFADSANAKFGTGNDMLMYHDGSNSYITNAVGALKIATETSGIALTIGHTTSETTIADNLTVTGTLTGTLATAAQGSVTSLGTLTALTVDDVAVDGKVVTMTGSASDTAVLTAGTNGTLSIVTTDDAAAAANIQITADGTVDIDSAGILTLDSGAAINIEPASGSAILLDGTISVDAGVVTGATSITSTAFVGALTGNVTGNTSGTAATVTTAAQSNITSLGTLTTLTVDNVIINGATIGHTGDTDLLTVASGALTVAGTIGSGAITSTGIVTGTAFTAGSAVLAEAELELLDGLTAGTAIASKVVTTDSSIDTTGQRNLTISGELDAATLDISSSIDIAGASQFSGAITVGVDDTGLDVKLFGASAGAYMEWDESIDTLRIVGASADATTSTGKLLLATSLTDINASDVLGKIDFQAPLEAGGTDAITVAASIQAMAQATFSSSVNATDLIFFTGHSEAATEKFRFTSQGEIGVGGANYGTDGQILTSGGAGAAPAWEDSPSGAVTAINNATANELVTIGATTTELEAEANLTFDGTDVLVGGSGKLQLRDTGLYIHSSTDGQLDLIADTEIQIAATTVDLNGILDVSGVLVAGGQISAADGTAGAPSISNTGDLNTGLLFSAADTMAFSAGGTSQFTMADGAISPVTDNDVDLVTASLEFKNVYVDGTTFTDALGFGTVVMTLPTADGSANQILTTDGSGALSFVDNSGGTDWQAVKTGAFTASAGQGVFVNTTSSAFAITLPAGTIGDEVSIIDYAGTFDSNNCTIAANGSEKIHGSTDDLTVATERAAFTLVFTDSTQGWLLTDK